MRSSPTLLPPLFWAGCALALCACGPVPVPGVEHLAPTLRTPDGPQPATASLQADRRVHARWSFDGSAWPAEWSFGNVRPGAGAIHGGQALVPVAPKGADMALTLAGTHAASAFNVVEVDLARRMERPATLTWRHAGSDERFRAVTQASGEGVVTLRFELDEGLGWEGALADLTLHPTAGWNQPLELLEVRCLHEPFVPGASPLADPGAGDGGLVVRDGVGVRAWPARAGDELTCEVEVPDGGRLTFAVARGVVAGAQPVGFAVRVGGAGEVGRVELGAGDGAWREGSVDLAAFAGERVELVFEAFREELANAAPGEPSGAHQLKGAPRADVLLGVPELLGVLPADRRPNVVLVTVDTTRRDALGPYADGASEGEPRESGIEAARVRTPFLDAFARDALVFDDAWSQSNSTQPSHASILTGLAVQDHALFDNYGVLSAEAETLAESLRAAGYSTAAATSQPAIGPKAGFGQGFDRFRVPDEATERDGRLAVDAAIDWLTTWNAAGDLAHTRPFFLWVHVFDPHTPYDPPAGALEAFEGATGSLPPRASEPPSLPPVATLPPELAFLEGVTSREHAAGLYQAEVAYTDGLLADLFAALDAGGRDTLAIVTADHGESLGERANYFNHRGLYPETVRVPLIVRLPEARAGERVATRVTNRDVTPTVRALLGLASAAPGSDLVAAAEAPPAAGARVWFEHANGFAVGCRDDQYHFTLVERGPYTFGLGPVAGTGLFAPVERPVGTVELYDHTVDPGLTRDLAAERPEVVQRYLDLLAARRAAARPLGSGARPLSDAEAARLEALGYTGE